MAEYPGAARAGVSPNRSARQGRVQLFIVHHYAGTQDPESAWRRFNAPNDRSVSPNYQVNADGSVFEVVPPDRFRAWTTGAIDHQAVTCETQNASGAPQWTITRESHEAIAQLVAWASKRYGFPIQRGHVADGNVVTVPGVVGHRETPAGRQTSTACPGPSMDLDWIVNRAQQIAGGSPANAPTETDDDMRVIKAPNRRPALIAAGYFRELNDEEASNMVWPSASLNDRQYDLNRAAAIGAVYTAPATGGMVIVEDNAGDRPLALLGAGYYRALSDEERANVGVLAERHIVGNTRQYDLWVSLALSGQAASFPIAGANLAALSDADVKRLATAAADELKARLAS